ncbi:hypothetical protein FGADI_12039 [Fusarium gaditjirri]|uniref:Carboxylic ester hydrolase n=1 Tax=Fusarium gaditjirri TaxID=282569 RepID=A0A8H4STL6_9HYPO|nr:hypothetical protein FGADI_12039 [Fusarium gaditjirri]
MFDNYARESYWRFRVPQRLPKDHRYGTATEPGKFTDGTRVCPQPPSSKRPDPSVIDEDCLQLNIWLPVGPAPKDGWPAQLVWIPRKQGISRRSELQSRSYQKLRTMGSEIGVGLDSREKSFFGSDLGNITVAGYSAGAYSSFQKLAHELFRVPEEKGIIIRVAMFSNSTDVTPKSLQDQQLQCDKLLTRLGINLALSDEDKLTSLRAVPHHKLVQVQNGIRIPELRVWADDTFYTADLMCKINNGEFAKRMKYRGIRLINGHCDSEHIMYRRWRTPQESYSAVYQRLLADSSPEATQKIMNHYCGSSKILPVGYSNWEDLFGRIYANIQVHHLQRGFHN